MRRKHICYSARFVVVILAALLAGGCNVQAGRESRTPSGALNSSAGPHTGPEASLVLRGEFVDTSMPGFDTAGCVVGDSLAWVYGDRLGLRRTTDSGQTWQVMKLLDSTGGTPKWVTSFYIRVFFITPTRGWLTGGDGTWQTEDGGKSWRQIFIERSTLPQFADSNRGWMLVEENEEMWRSYVSVDRGSSWNPCGPLYSYNKSHTPERTAYFLNDGVGWAVTGYKSPRGNDIKGIAHTGDGGCNWVQLWNGKGHMDGRYSGVYFLNNRRGWLAGDRLLHTEDGGRGWKNLNFPASVIYISDVHFYDDRTGWVVNLNTPPGKTGVYKTSDGGNSWRQLSDEEYLSAFNSATETGIPADWKNGKLRQMLYRQNRGL